MRTILAFCGVKQSGKTTAFDIIQDSFPEVIEIQLARKLKDESAKIAGFPRDHLDLNQFKEKNLKEPLFLTPEMITSVIKSFGYTPDFDLHVRPHIGTVLYTPRQVAQYVGTEICKNVDPEIHCKYATKDLPEDAIFVVTDMRFPDEFEYFKANYPKAFSSFYIQNYNAESISKEDPHPSERLVLETAKLCAVKIENNDSMRAYKDKILESINKVFDDGKDITVQETETV